MATAESVKPHSILRGVIVALVYLATMISISIYVFRRRRRQGTSRAAGSRPFGGQLR